VVYETSVGSGPFLALVKGDPSRETSTPCRMHSGALLADVFGSDTLEGRHNLRHALEHIERVGHGVVVYLPPKLDMKQELAGLGRRHGSVRSSAAPAFDEPHSPSGPPLREFGLGAQILRDLGLRRIRLLTNHPRKIAGIDAYGLEVVECVALGQPSLESD
jgi:3,4-dihydroxy 2-butanone 4-phosphate synthase/GTP cyclohydrolase II